jgi:hypothetical protein
MQTISSPEATAPREGARLAVGLLSLALVLSEETELVFVTDVASSLAVGTLEVRH